ncbi:MAG TPA: DNA-directed RNA polymerase subunit alpha C-terminal domain-containing protein [Stellaceae bacterium]|jgi:hypothetical protein
MTGLDWSKLAKIIGMMGSAAEGEALNARDLAQAMLREAGLSWFDLKSLVAKGHAPVPAPPSFAQWDRYGGGVGPNVNHLIIELQDTVRRLMAENEALKQAVEESRVYARSYQQRLQEHTRGLEQQLENAGAVWRAVAKENERLRGMLARAIAQPKSAQSQAEPAEPAEADWPIAGLDVSARLKNALCGEGITTLRAAARMHSAELLHIPNIGKKSFRELCGVCRAKGVAPPEGAIF